MSPGRHAWPGRQQAAAWPRALRGVAACLVKEPPNCVTWIRKSQITVRPKRSIDNETSFACFFGKVAIKTPDEINRG